jgi:hypothetical protein
MQLTNFTIFNSIESLNKLALLKFPVKVGFALIKNIKKLDELNALINKKREEIVNTYAVRNPDNSPMLSKDNNGNDVPNTIQISNMIGFNKDMSDLMNFMNEVDISQVKISDMGDHIVELEVLAKLDWLFTE